MKSATIQPEQTDETDISHPQPFVSYIRDEKQVPHGVLLAERYGDHVVVGFALCSPRDKFDKKRGKQIAKGRAIAYFNSTRVILSSPNHGNSAIMLYTEKSKHPIRCTIGERSVRIPIDIQKAFNRFMQNCKKYYQNCTFPAWTELV